ncbi:DUF732 domain-containing protein [Streptomyces sp. SAS_272]|uniref:DUF732 domain-containing protein n=1 Tax=Streptomyces sp. SAS_272 TaxID=3412747 RepID=UPI00403D106E
MRLRSSLLTAALFAVALSGCASSEEDEAHPGPLPSEVGHAYSAEQSAYLAAVRDLGWPPGTTERDALFAALAVCAKEKEGVSDAPLLAHEVSDNFGLEGADAMTVAAAADVAFCLTLGEASSP